MWTSVWIVLLPIITVSGTSVPSPAPVVTSAVEIAALRLAGPPVDDDWQKAEVVGPFTQRDPNDGARPTFPTDAKVAFDDDAIYVSVNAQDTDPGALVGHLTRRDVKSSSDWITIAIDSAGDKRTAYEFSVNPRGVKADAYLLNDGRTTDMGWDAVWDVQVIRHDSGWRAVFRIPFSQLRFRSARQTTMGLAVTRQVGRLNEVSMWPHISKAAAGFVSQFASVRDLRLPQRTKQIELVPYMVAGLETLPEETSIAPSPRRQSSIGLDARYSRPSVAVTATLNPDFGQVEADPAVVNLTAFETFLTERRPFFVEGSSAFRFDANCSNEACTSNVFYPRRIGRPPQLALATPAGGESLVPIQTTVLGAVKATAQVAGFSVGVLNALTSAEAGTLKVGAVTTRPTVEPWTNYTVVRARRQFANQSAVGLVGTVTARRLNADLRMLPGGAYVGGVEGEWRPRQGYTVAAYWLGSVVSGDAGAITRLQENTVHAFQRPDAGHVDIDRTRTTLRGHSALLSVGKIGGQRLRFASTTSFRSPGYDVNDVGFLRRADLVTVANSAEVRWDRPTRLWRFLRMAVSQSRSWNFDGDTTAATWQIAPYTMFTNQVSSGFYISYQPSVIDDRATRGGPRVRQNARRSFGYYVSGDPRKTIAPGVDGSIAGGSDGYLSWFVSSTTSIRASRTLTMSVGARYVSTRDPQQWLRRVASTRDHFLFARLGQTTTSLTGRINWTLTPALTVQVYAEPFVSAGHYSHVRELAEGLSADPAVRLRPYAYDGSRHDFNIRSFRSTSVLRWEYRAGSTLFVVWQQGRSGGSSDGQFSFGRDFGAVFDTPARNTLLIKAAYWFNK